jgi:hypothetical protein
MSFATISTARAVCIGADQLFDGHETVTHSVKEYVRGDVHTKTVEGYFRSLSAV